MTRTRLMFPLDVAPKLTLLATVLATHTGIPRFLHKPTELRAVP